jgi:hypothetical protein
MTRYKIHLPQVRLRRPLAEQGNITQDASELAVGEFNSLRAFLPKALCVYCRFGAAGVGWVY